VDVLREVTEHHLHPLRGRATALLHREAEVAGAVTEVAGAPEAVALRTQEAREAREVRAEVAAADLLQEEDNLAFSCFRH